MCGYRKGFSTQQGLLSLIERLKNTLDQNGYGGAILMDLSKAFDTINHDLLIAKLGAYGFGTESLKLIRSYLTNRFQKTKVNTSFSSSSKLFLGIPQGSVLGPLLFNIYIIDLFHLTEKTDVCNYADDTNFHACDLDLKSLITRLEHDATLAIEWSESNYMMLNQDKCHFLFSGHKYETLFVNVGETKILERKQQKLSDILIDRDLKLDEYVLSQCKKAGKKLTALIRISKFMTFAQRRNIMKAFIESQFGYCQTERQTNVWINHMHERALRAVYNDEISPFEELTGKHKSETIHRRNIKILAAELFKIKNDLSNNLGYSLRSPTDFSLLQVKSVNYGLKSFLVRKYGIFYLVIFKTLEHFKNFQKNSSHGFLETVLVESVKVTYIK